METECKLLNTCGFFKKYQSTKNLACKGFMQQYCNGSKMAECKRLEYREKHGMPPNDDMMPTGHTCITK